MQKTPQNQPPQAKHVTKHLNKKHLFAMFKNNPRFFINFLFFSTYSFFCRNCCVLLKNYEIVLSTEHNYWKTQLVTATFSPISQKHLKNCHFWFYILSLQPLFYIFLGQARTLKNSLARTDSVHENAVCSPFQTPIVFCNFCTKNNFSFISFLATTQKTVFDRVVCFFGGCFFVASSFLANQHKTQQP